MKMKYIFFCIAFCYTFSSCIKNNPAPSWLEVSEWTLNENANAQFPTGELTHSFTEAWVFVNGEQIGVFEVPFKIPLLVSGSANVKIYPAIKNNGISATKKIYPFMEVFEKDIVLVENETVKLNLVTEYYASTNFWIEDFEDVNLKIESDPNSEAELLREDDPSILKYGLNYGHIAFVNTDQKWGAVTNGNLVLPKGGKEVYIEIDYHNTNSFTVGVASYSSSATKNNPYIQLNAQQEASVKWKKAYIDIKEIVSSSTDADVFEITFEAIKNTLLTTSDIYIDNIKVVYI